MACMYWRTAHATWRLLYLSQIRLSATAIQDWEECKLRFLYRYIYGLKPFDAKESQRVGETWHGCHEIIRMVPQGKCPKCYKRGTLRSDCYLCNGTGVLPADLMDAVMRYVAYRYAKVPERMTAAECEAERITLLYSFSGYRWLFPQDRFDTVASEVWFNIPIINPETRREFQDARLVGKADHLLRDKESGLLYIGERKSTSKDLDDLSYWSRLDQDVQITSYLYALRMAQLRGELRQYGVAETDPLIHGIWYDVWHKPGIKPKTLSQADTAEFLKTQTYCGERFRVAAAPGVSWRVNGAVALVVPGKKADSIIETPEMFGARLLQDIAARPAFYFEQREIPRSDEQLVEFERDLARYVKAIRAYEQGDLWTPNCRSCESPFWCEFHSLCQRHAKIGPNDTPEGFMKGKSIEQTK